MTRKMKPTMKDVPPLKEKMLVRTQLETTEESLDFSSDSIWKVVKTRVKCLSMKLMMR